VTSSSVGEADRDEVDTEEDTVVCGFCNGRDAPTTSTSPSRPFDAWLWCDVCGVWHHNICEGLSNDEVPPPTHTYVYCA